MTDMKTKRAEAIKLLRKYEKLKAELRVLEPEMRKAVIAYGKTTGRAFMRPETLKIELEMEAERRGKAA